MPPVFDKTIELLAVIVPFVVSNDASPESAKVPTALFAPTKWMFATLFPGVARKALPPEVTVKFMAVAGADGVSI